MFAKTKSKNNTESHLTHLGFDLARLSTNLGFAAMSAAAVLSLVEVEHFKQERFATLQPAFATVNASPHDNGSGAELFRRGEKEESPHSIVSYGTTMRSHATSGRA